MTMLAMPPITTSRRLFLGVERSVCGRAWRDRLDERGTARALSIAQRHNLPELLARILAGRNVDIDDVETFLDPTIKRLMPDPHTLTAMQAAAERIADAVQRGESVAIFGDYDVDGATASALLARFLRQGGLDPMIHIPDRIFEGYGPNVEAIRSLADRGAKLLVTVDCGTTSMEPLAEAQRLGLDVVVIDHHQADEELPPAVAVVNPNRRDDLSGLGHLAAVGLTFLTIVAINRELRKRGFWTEARPEPDLLDFLHVVALGTIADVVPLKGLNRAFVAKGMISLRRREHVGLTALMDAARLSGPPEPWHLGFMLGPRINAGGRIGRADLGVRLLMESDPIEGARLAAELDRLNGERQVIERATLAEAEAEALAALGLEEKGAVVVTAAEGWHPGVVGLVAARLKERYCRPAFAVAIDPNGIGTGSGRSIPGVDLGQAVRRAVAEGLLLKGGGHAMAAGVTLAKGGLAAFRAYLEETLGAAVLAARRDDALLIDAAVTAAGATAETVATIARAGPFGSGNAEPVVALPAHTLVYAEEVGQNHIRARLKAGDGAFVNAIAFRAAGQKLGNALMQNRGRAIHAAGSLALDRWQGAERVQLRLLDIAMTDGFPQ
ncbi:MAG: single-stranded-DNA-specific exonuclease [Alphaproteobacteria bacterium]|jgi:single-stranded-DNA-specific exonuclease|nr:single-stranded-DNA-specific exonuclease [Alphaproteobacteria bacterium]